MKTLNRALIVVFEELAVKSLESTTAHLQSVPVTTDGSSCNRAVCVCECYVNYGVVCVKCGVVCVCMWYIH